MLAVLSSVNIIKCLTEQVSKLNDHAFLFRKRIIVITLNFKGNIRAGVHAHYITLCHVCFSPCFNQLYSQNCLIVRCQPWEFYAYQQIYQYVFECTWIKVRVPKNVLWLLLTPSVHLYSADIWCTMMQVQYPLNIQYLLLVFTDYYTLAFYFESHTSLCHYNISSTGVCPCLYCFHLAGGQKDHAKSMGKQYTTKLNSLFHDFTFETDTQQNKSYKHSGQLFLLKITKGGRWE